MKKLIVLSLLLSIAKFSYSQKTYFRRSYLDTKINTNIPLPQNYKGLPVLLDSFYRSDQKTYDFLTLDRDGYFVIKNQYILLRDTNNKRSPESIMKAHVYKFNKTNKKFNEIDINSIKVLEASDCNTNLFLIECVGCENLEIIGNPEGAQGSGNKPSGPGSGTIFSNTVLPAQNNDGPKLNFPIQETRLQQKTKDTVKIAVLDTGIDTDGTFFNNYSSNLRMDLGKSFIGTSLLDDNEHKHGTAISRIIISQISERFRTANFQIIPIKTLDKNAMGNLYDALEAICYAKSLKVNVINASWGFYQNIKYNVKRNVFRSIINEYIESGGKFICSAGNDYIDLEKKTYYPACFSGNFKISDRLTTVTSLMWDNKTTSLKNYENYSKIFATVGVVANFDEKTNLNFGENSIAKLRLDILNYNNRVPPPIRPLNENMFFIIPSQIAGIYEFAIGTSYATPYFVALVAKEILRLPDPLPSNLDSYETRIAIDLNCPTTTNDIKVKEKRIYFTK